MIINADECDEMMCVDLSNSQTSDEYILKVLYLDYSTEYTVCAYFLVLDHLAIYLIKD